MRTTISENIDGDRYVITTFDAIKGNRILIKLFKYLRGASSVLNGLSGNVSILDSELSLGDMLSRIMEDMEPEEMSDFIVMMLQDTSVNDKPLTEDLIKDHFSAKYLTMYKVVVAIIKANYFGEGTKSFLDAARQKLNPMPSQEQTDSPKA